MKHKQLWKKQLAIFQIIDSSNKFRVGHDGNSSKSVSLHSKMEVD